MSTFQEAVGDNTTEQTAGQQGQFPQETQTQAPVNEPKATILEDGSVVVNGKIYKPEAAAKKIEHADTHIKRLEQENAEKDVTTLQLLERLEALEAKRNHADALDKLVNEAQPQAPVQPEPPRTQEVSKEELIEATVDRIKAERVAEQQEANLKDCVAQAKEIFGDTYGSKIDELGSKHGMNTQQIVEMARNQPSVFRALFVPNTGPKGKPDTTSSTVSGMVGQSTQGEPKHKSFLRMSAKERQALIAERMNQLSN